jgi:hypothetical protein
VCIHALDPEPLTNTGVRWRLTFASPGFQQIQVVRNHDTSLAFFALGVDGRMYYAQQNGANGAWGGLIDLGGEGLRDFAVAKNQDGRLELFVIGSDEAIYHRWQAWHSSVDWYGWYSSVAGVFAIWPRPRIPTARWCSSSWARTATSTAASRPRRTAAGVPGRP